MKSTASSASSPRLDGIKRGLEQVDVVHTRNLDRILEGQEYTGTGAFFRRHIDEILALELDLAIGHGVIITAGEHMGERTLAGPVRAHDGVDFAGLHFQINAAQDVGFVDLGM